MKYPSIFERELTTMRPQDGIIDAVEIIQRDDRKWQINVNVSWRPDMTHTVFRYNVRRIKLYVSVNSAIEHVTGKYGYRGKIVVHPKADETLQI